LKRFCAALGLHRPKRKRAIRRAPPVRNFTIQQVPRKSRFRQSLVGRRGVSGFWSRPMMLPVWVPQFKSQRLLPLRPSGAEMALARAASARTGDLRTGLRRRCGGYRGARRVRNWSAAPAPRAACLLCRSPHLHLPCVSLWYTFSAMRFWACRWCSWVGELQWTALLYTSSLLKSAARRPRSPKPSKGSHHLRLS
jgi:hypothetical protein